VGMKGLVEEGSEVMEEGFEDAVLDAGLIGAARRVEHYEMAAYGAVCEFAKILGQTRHASLLEKTQAEEKQTDDKLAELAKGINAQANEEGLEEQQGTARSGRKTPRRAA
jgi:ferritin-like metal-binding protein YciE